MDSVLSWIVMTVCCYWLIFRVAVKAIEDKEERLHEGEEFWKYKG